MAYLDINLERDGFNQPWGFRMVGGSDVGKPLTVSRVTAGTASEGLLRVGDVITVIRGQDATQMTHQDATDAFKNAGNTMKITVARGLPVNGAQSPGTPRTSAVDAPFGGSAPSSRKTSQVGKPPARKFSDPRLSYLIPQQFKQFHVVQTPTTYLPTTAFSQTPKSPIERELEESYREEYQEKALVVDQPYRTTPLITPGAKVKRDTPLVASYLHMHPDPQVRGAAPHVTQVSVGMSNMIHSANDQIARKVADNVRTAAGYIPPQQDRLDRAGPRIIHHQFNTPINMYSAENVAHSLKQQTGISPSMGPGPRKEFNVHESEALKAILEEDSARPSVHQPKSHVVYDVHQAKVLRPRLY